MASFFWLRISLLKRVLITTSKQVVLHFHSPYLCLLIPCGQPSLVLAWQNWTWSTESEDTFSTEIVKLIPRSKPIKSISSNPLNTPLDMPTSLKSFGSHSSTPLLCLALSSSRLVAYCSFTSQKKNLLELPTKYLAWYQTRSQKRQGGFLI